MEEHTHEKTHEKTHVHWFDALLLAALGVCAGFIFGVAAALASFRVVVVV